MNVENCCQTYMAPSFFNMTLTSNTLSINYKYTWIEKKILRTITIIDWFAQSPDIDNILAVWRHFD